VEHITLEQQSDMVRELEANDIMICVNNSHGNHVVQKFLECVPADRLSFVKSFRGKVLELGQHPYGCRVLQRCFEHLPEDRSRPLLDELHLHSNVLMQDQYGNYVIQFVIEHGKPADCGRVIDLLHGQLLAMASHKFASNVCEKALLHASRENREGLINEMLALRSDGNTAIPLMVKDQYANYVLQRAMRVAEGDMSERLFAELLFVVPNLRKFAGASPKHLNASELSLCSVRGSTLTPFSSTHSRPSPSWYPARLAYSSNRLISRTSASPPYTSPAWTGHVFLASAWLPCALPILV
jgi:pumilio RNA-binding family